MLCHTVEHPTVMINFKLEGKQSKQSARLNIVASKKTFKLVFRVKKAYYEQIVAGTKTTEFREQTAYWQKVLSNLNKFFERAFGWKAWLQTERSEPWTAEVEGINAIFITCLKGQSHTRKVLAIGQQVTPSELRELINTPKCYTFYLGAEVKPDAS